jgi:hypothetical protein
VLQDFRQRIERALKQAILSVVVKPWLLEPIRELATRRTDSSYSQVLRRSWSGSRHMPSCAVDT